MLDSFTKVWLSDDPLSALGVAFAANEKPLKVVVGSASSASLKRTDALLARSTPEEKAKKVGKNMAG